MPLKIQCVCTLCNIESHLLSEFARSSREEVGSLFSAFSALRQHSSIFSLLSHLRTARAADGSDELFRELLALHKTNPSFVERVLVLAFLPMLHQSIRLMTRRQAGLAEEDATQQAVSFLLEFLQSKELQERRSHFAFAIARSVKRRMFEWANREGSTKSALSHFNSDAPVYRSGDSVERRALLRHFLHRCVAHGLLKEGELNLFIQFKLDGTSGEELAALHGSTSNAVRQKFKRVLQKLRRLARSG
jgi:DNA-directed RNA polymerase specialized sigma24 family protein